MLQFLNEPPRYLFFTGKGGVGKTSLATAGAVSLADAGRRVLLVSTDPASNLGQVLETEVGPEILPVRLVPGLSSLNIDPEGAAEAYRDRVLGPVRGELPESEVRKLEEQLSGACTTEIASFDEFTQLLTHPGHGARFDHVIFDTAPTGHTLRLLELPSAWSSFMVENPDGASCLGPLSGLESQRAQYLAAVSALNDPARTLLVLVTRPEVSALKEAGRSSRELERLGVRNQHLVVNGVFRASDPSDPFARAMEDRGREALAGMPESLETLSRESVLLRGQNLVGLEALRRLALRDTPDRNVHQEAPDHPPRESPPEPSLLDLTALVDDVEADGRGLVMTMGKGGVGKTTMAAAIAVELACRGHHVHLSTTDPAAHIEHALHEAIEHLTVSRIDPETETRRYSEKVLATRGKGLDEEGRRLLEEDLRSPCTEEVAVFHAFSRLVREAARGVVILDTAPTGHTLLLLDQTGAYHREVQRHARDLPGRATTPLMRLQDPEYTKLLIVTLPETTPVLEAVKLQNDLRRAEIEPYAWIVNQSLAASGPADPLLVERASAEGPQIQAVADRHAARTHLVPWAAYEPVGAEALQALVGGRAVLEMANAEPAHSSPS